MLALVPQDWLDVIVPRTRQPLALLETLWFSYCPLPALLPTLDLVVADSSLVFRDEIGPGRLRNGRSDSLSCSFGDLVSPHSRIVSHKRGWFCTRDAILAPLLCLNRVSAGARVVDNFMERLIGRFKYGYFLIVLGLEGMRVVLNDRKITSDGPGWLLVLNTYLFYLGTLNYLLLWNFIGSGI